MSVKKPIPSRPGREPRICPYCRQPSYSASGVHPQCIQHGNDQLAKQQLALRTAASASSAHGFDNLRSAHEQDTG